MSGCGIDMIAPECAMSQATKFENLVEISSEIEEWSREIAEQPTPIWSASRPRYHRIGLPLARPLGK
jgi:hypothetical protein